MRQLHSIGQARRAADPGRSFGLLLRGGGNGALAAGFIDELLADGFRFDAISAAGAGVANAVVLAFGLAQGGPECGRRVLKAFWRIAGEHGSPLTGPNVEDSTDPARIEAALRRLVDFSRIRDNDGVALFLAATNVAAGKPRLFSKAEIDLDTTLAAMAPLALTRTVDGQPYCAAGLYEELAILPLSGDHRPGEIVAAFFAPAMRARLMHSTTEDLWAIGRASAKAWMSARAFRARRRLPVLDDTTPLAA